MYFYKISFLNGHLCFFYILAVKRCICQDFLYTKSFIDINLYKYLSMCMYTYIYIKFKYTFI